MEQEPRENPAGSPPISSERDQPRAGHVTGVSVFSSLQQNCCKEQVDKKVSGKYRRALETQAAIISTFCFFRSWLGASWGRDDHFFKKCEWQCVRRGLYPYYTRRQLQIKEINVKRGWHWPNNMQTSLIKSVPPYTKLPLPKGVRSSLF